MTSIVVAAPQARDIAQVDSLTEWVIAAPVEEVCWRLTEISGMRDWLQTQKEATELRVRAVRLEMIALRKVALAGLASKIAGSAQLRSCAKWLQSLTDEEFEAALRELDGDKSPIALYRADKTQRDALAEALAEPDSEWERRTHWTAAAGHEKHDSSLTSAADVVLRDLVENGQPFTVSEAAERLAAHLDLDVEVRSETAEGLREMVRWSIRHSGSTRPVDEWSSLPVALTFEAADGTYLRVPAASATVGHLVAHVKERRYRAEAAVRRVEEMEELVRRLMVDLGVPELDPTLATEDQMAKPLAPLVDAIRNRGRRGHAERFTEAVSV